jgi:hypothetical protein
MQAPAAPSPYVLELVRSSFAICVALITLGLTWFVGQKLGSRWAVWQKKREIELASISEFYQMYGEFLAIWRTWKFTSGWEEPEREATRRKLFERSAIANGKIEAIIAKVAIERVLNPAEIGRWDCFAKRTRGFATRFGTTRQPPGDTTTRSTSSSRTWLRTWVAFSTVKRRLRSPRPRPGTSRKSPESAPRISWTWWPNTAGRRACPTLPCRASPRVFSS